MKTITWDLYKWVHFLQYSSPAPSASPLHCLPPSCPLHSNPLPPVRLSAVQWSEHRAGDYSRLSCPQDHWPSSGTGPNTEPAAASDSTKHMPFRKTPEGLATLTHLANATGKGFILWATLDRISAYIPHSNRPLTLWKEHHSQPC